MLRRSSHFEEIARLYEEGAAEAFRAREDDRATQLRTAADRVRALAAELPPVPEPTVAMRG